MQRPGKVKATRAWLLPARFSSPVAVPNELLWFAALLYPLV